MRFILRYRLSSFAFATAICALSFGQVKNIGIPDLKNYTKNDYKGATQNWNIDQDGNHNVYFANNEGLFQFDGSAWTKYSIPNNKAIRSLKIDSENTIYVGGYNKFGYFKSNKKGKLIYTSLSDLIPEKQRNQIDFIWKINTVGSDIYFQSFEHLYVLRQKKITIIKAPSRFQFSFVVENNLIIQDKKLGLLKFNKNKFEVLKNTKSLNSTEVWGIFAINSNDLIIATIDKGLFLYQNNNLTTWTSEANDFLKTISCLGGTVLNKSIIFNSVLNGIIITDFDGKILQRINLKNGLQNNTVLSSFVDKGKNIWLGLDNGITIINENDAFSFLGLPFDLSTVYASVVFENNLYVATNQGLFYHPWKKEFQNSSFNLVAGTTGQAWNIQIANNQLFCSHNKGLLLISGNKVQTNLDSKNGYWGIKSIPNRPEFFIGANYNGFSVFENQLGHLQFRNRLKGVSKSSTNYEIDAENIWLKKDNLLFKYQFDTSLNFLKSSVSIKSMGTDNFGVASIQKLNDTVYFQNDAVFYYYSKTNNAFVANKKWSSVFREFPKISYVKQDQFKNIWIGNNQTLSFLKFKNNKFESITKPFYLLKENIASEFISINAVDSKNIFIGLTNGLAHLNPDKLLKISQKPKVIIKSVVSANDTLNYGNNRLQNALTDLKYKNNGIKFMFSSPNYNANNQVQYSYFLDGFDKKWSDWSTTNSKEYTNLFEGKYAMKVRVKDALESISNDEVFNFKITPPWYRSIFAYLFYLIAIGLLVYLVRLRTEATIRKNKYFETIEQRKIYLEKEAKIKQEQFKLENEIERLTNEQLKIKLLSKDKELVNNSFQVVKKNKILKGIISNLQDFDVNTLSDENKSKFVKLNKNIVKEVNSENKWKDLERHIRNENADFLKRLKANYPTISPREMDLSTYLLLNMSTKEIAEIMNISTGGVELARYRLRKKLKLNKENLVGFLMNI